MLHFYSENNPVIYFTSLVNILLFYIYLINLTNEKRRANILAPIYYAAVIMENNREMEADDKLI